MRINVAGAEGLPPRRYQDRVPFRAMPAEAAANARGGRAASRQGRSVRLVQQLKHIVCDVLELSIHGEHQPHAGLLI
jgi:hypothetical protein